MEKEKIKQNNNCNRRNKRILISILFMFITTFVFSSNFISSYASNSVNKNIEKSAFDNKNLNYSSYEENLFDNFFTTLINYMSDDEREKFVNNLSDEEIYKMEIHSTFELALEVVSTNGYSGKDQIDVDRVMRYENFTREIQEKAKNINLTNSEKEKIESEMLNKLSKKWFDGFEIYDKTCSSFDDLYKEIQKTTLLNVNDVVEKIEKRPSLFRSASSISQNFENYLKNIYGINRKARVVGPNYGRQSFSYKVLTANSFPAEYSFRPKFTSSTQAKLEKPNSGFNNANNQPNKYNGYTWTTYGENGVMKVLKKGDSWYKPKNTDNNKFQIRYTNVGSYNGQKLDLVLTLTNFSTTSEVAGVGFGQKNIAFGYPAFHNVKMDHYKVIDVKISLYKAGTQNLATGVKGHMMLNDLDYFKSTSEAIDLISGCGNTVYIESKDSNKFVTSGHDNRILTKSKTGGTSPDDGANAVFTFNGPEFKIRSLSGNLTNFDQGNINISNYINKDVTVLLHANGGTINSSVSGFSIDGEGYICKNGQRVKHTIKDGGQLGADGLADVNNPNWINIVKNGYHYSSGKQWKTNKGFTAPGKTYDQYKIYKASDFGKAGQTITLYANHVPNRHNVAFDTQGGNRKSVNFSGYLTPDSGWYRIQSAKGPYIHVLGMNRENGATYVTWETGSATVSDGNNALYYLDRYKDTQYYFIINCRSGKYMQLDGNESNVISGATGGKNSKPYQHNLVWKSNYEPEADFLWSFKQVGSYVSIINKANNLAFDLPNGETANATVIQMYPSNNSITQQFSLLPNASVTSNYHTKDKVFGSTLHIPYSIPEKAGYEFVNWNTSADGTGTSYSPGANYTHDQNGGTVTLYAQWRAAYSDVTYKPNGGNGVDQVQKVQNGAYWTTEGAIYNKTGYHQTGWNLNSYGTSTNYGLSTIQSPINSNLTLYAEYSPNNYTVRFHGNGATSGSMTDQAFIYDQYQNLRSNAFYKTGYTFAGWSTSEYGSVSYSNGEYVKNLTSANDGVVDLYAKWTPNKYYVRFNGNGSTSGYMSDQTFTYDQYQNLKSNAFYKTGYTFAGWSTSAYGSVSYSNEQYVKNLTSTNGDVVDLYAKWNINTYTNTISHWASGFKNGEGNNDIKNSFRLADTNFTAVYNSSFVMNSSRQTRIPNGFYLANTFGTSSISDTWRSYSMGTTVTQKPYNMSFEYYYYPSTYNITYKLNGGTNNSSNPSTYNVLYGVTLKEPTRTGYTFAGWYNRNTKVDGINPGANATFTSSNDLYNKLAGRTTGDQTLEARWKANKYYVRFNGNGSTSGSMVDQVFTYDVAQKLNENKFLKTGYQFKNWNTKPDGTGTTYANKQEVKNLASKEGAIVNLYAQWQENTLTVNYYSNNATRVFTGALNSNSIGEGKNVLVRTVKLKATTVNPDLIDYYDTTDAGKIMRRDYYTGTGKYGTASQGGNLVSEKATFTNVMELAKAFGGNVNNGDGTINIYPQWRKNKLYIQYNSNKGKLYSDSSKEYSLDNQNYILKNNSKDYHVVEFDQTIGQNGSLVGLYNCNNPGSINVKLTGHTATEHKEWNTKSDGTGTSYDQDVPYKVSDFANLKDSDKTVKLYVNWRKNVLKVYYNSNKGKIDTSKGFSLNDKEDILKENKEYYQIFYYNNPNKDGLEDASKFGIYNKGFKFLGWTLEKNTNDIFEENNNDIVSTDLKKAIENGDASVKLYARWKLNIDIFLDVESEIYHVNDVVTPQDIRETLKIKIIDKDTNEDITDSVFPGIIEEVKTVELEDYDLVKYDVEKNLDTRVENHFKTKYEITITDLDVTITESITQKITVIKDIEDIEQFVPDPNPDDPDPNPVDPDGGGDEDPLTPDPPNVDPNEGYNRNTTSDIRYISKKYLGTINKNSKWRTNSELNQKLKTTLNKKATDENSIYIIEITKEEADSMKEWLVDGKIWNVDLNKDFINNFSSIIKKKP